MKRLKNLIILTFLAVASGQVTQKEQRWDGLMPYTSSKGYACVSPCVRKIQEIDYYCYVREVDTGIQNEHGSLDTCSPNPHEDIQGTQCRTPCKYDSYHKRYQCQTILGYHQFCGRTVGSSYSNLVGRVKTYRGDYCTSACQKEGNSTSYWCYRPDRAWSHCSPKPGHDINGTRCLNKCDYYGKGYTWCDVEGGGWSYCSTTEVGSETEFTVIGSKCLTPCVGTPDGRNRCWDASEDYRECSRVMGLNSQNQICSGNTCAVGDGSEDYSFYWCAKPNEDDWDFCSLVKEDEEEEGGGGGLGRKYFRKESINAKLTATNKTKNIFYLRDEQGIGKVTFYEANRETGRSPRQEPVWLEEEIQEGISSCLSVWRNSKYAVGKSGVAERVLLAKTGKRDGIRLEQERRYKRDGEEYVKLQLRSYGSKYNIGEVDVPVKVVDKGGEEVVGAMLKSVYGGFPVFIGTFSY